MKDSDGKGAWQVKKKKKNYQNNIATKDMRTVAKYFTKKFLKNHQSHILSRRA